MIARGTRVASYATRSTAMLVAVSTYNQSSPVYGYSVETVVVSSMACYIKKMVLYTCLLYSSNT